MQRFAAANNLTVTIDSGRWALVNGRAGNDEAVVEATADGLIYQPVFGTARRLPVDGLLPADQIAMVVVGWAAEDSSWHLGVLLRHKAAQARGGRWCGLARWPGSDGAQAEQAGAALADQLDVPFKLVPSQEEAAAGPATPTAPSVTAPAPAPAVALMTPPISVGEWILSEEYSGISWERTKSWRTDTLVRAAFFGFLTPVFGFLSIGALASPYAPVQPGWLPFVGLGITALMLFSAASHLRAYLGSSSTFIDTRVRIVRQKMQGRRRVRQTPFESIQYVLVSHVVSRRATKTEMPGYQRIWAEAWIHVFSPRRGFILVCQTDGVEGKMRADIDFSVRRPLDLREIDTPAHHAALMMAREMNIPAFVDAR